MIFYVVIGCLTAVIIAEKLFSYLERRELCDRIMSSSLKEFKKAEGKTEACDVPSAHDRVMRQWRGKE